jgi:hypothetical protein
MTSPRPPMPARRTVYFCKEPGCKWERLEPPGAPTGGAEARYGFAEALRDLALDYDTHEANEHPGSRTSGLTTKMSDPHDCPD